MLGKFKGLKVSTKLSGVVGAALVALCVMGAIAVFATRNVEELGNDLHAESARFAKAQMRISVDIERAIGDVNSAPSELDLAQLKVKQDRFEAHLGDVKKAVDEVLSRNTAAGVSAGAAGLVAGIEAFDTASKKVFEFTASFAQPDAIAALAEKVAPAQVALYAALDAFRAAAEQRDAEKQAAITATTSTIAWIVVGMATVLVLGLAALAYATVSRGVVRPITALNGVMTRLSGNDVTVEVPCLGRHDEIGDMARSVQVFKENAIERERLQASQAEEQSAKERRATRVGELIGAFDERVGATLRTVSAAATELEATAQSLVATARQTDAQAGMVTTASTEAASNVQTVAAATEQLSASITEIGSHVGQSSAITADAVNEAERATGTVQNLAEAAKRIGDVVQLISGIASQTNLLALNATIEAARAGEAGKGFAVVASEVKALANQTAKATDEIAQQIAAMQTETDGTVAAIGAIRTVIGEVRGIATTIAGAIEEQNAATAEISRNVQEAARGTEQVSVNIAGVSQGASETQAAGGEVLSASGELARNAEELRAEIERFLADIRAA